jgi:predicted Zn-dependent protease
MFAVLPGPAEGVNKSKFSFSDLFKNVTFQRIIRVGRVIFVSIAIYQTGYQNGMVHFAQDPKAVEEEMIKFSLGIDQKDKIEDHIHPRTSLTHKRIRDIGGKIIAAAREHSVKQLTASKVALAAITEEDTAAKKDRAEADKLLWERACRRLKGDWTFVVCKSPEVNAFVSGFCPNKVFVFEGLLNRLKLTDDELAMILGHEMSHVVLGHIEEQTPTTAIIMGTQLVLMSLIDPIGLGSFLFDVVVYRFGNYIQASYSRQHEYEADELGLLLTSMACFDIHAGGSVHEKLAELSHHHTTGLNDSHPSSVERRRNLMNLACTHEKERMVDPMFSQFKRDCIAIRQAWNKVVFGK